VLFLIAALIPPLGHPLSAALAIIAGSFLWRAIITARPR
jgi:hypothetical protein